MELRHIRYFIAVAEAGHFTRAAAALGMAQPPLSQQIRALEEEVGVKLLHRVPHGAELTAAGTAFLREARQAIAAAERATLAAQRAHRGESGQLALGVNPSSTYNPLISTTIEAFHHRWPDVAVSLAELYTTQLLEGLRSGALDAAFIRPSPEDVVDGISLLHLADEATVVALPTAHPLADRETVRLAELAGEPLILFPRQVGPCLRDEILAAFDRAGVAPCLGQEAGRTADTINLVAAHLGVSIVPQSLTQIRLAGVAYRPIEGPAPLARLALALPRGPRAPITRNFVELLVAAPAER